MTVGERIRKRRLELGLSVEQLAERINKDRATVYRYESNFIEKLPLSILTPLAEALRVSAAYLMGWDENKSNGSVPLTLPKSAYEGIPGAFPPDIEIYNIPILGKIAAGKPIFIPENYENEYIASNHSPETHFALRVTGDSMIGAGILDGSIVIAKKQECADNGQIIVAVIDNHATVKRFKHIGKNYFLFAENPNYDPIPITKEYGIRIIGVVIECKSFFK